MSGGLLHGRSRLTYLLRIVGVASAIALVFGAGTVFGALGDSQPTTFYACAQRGGLLSTISTRPPAYCGPSGHLVSWGAEGPSGATGPSGPTGATGLSHGYIAHDWDVTEYTPRNVEQAEYFFELTGLPEGKYMVTAVETAILPTVSETNQLLQGGALECSLSPAGSMSRQALVVGGAEGVGVAQEDLSVTVVDAVSIVEGQPIQLICEAPIGSKSAHAVISAVAVDALN